MQKNELVKVKIEDIGVGGEGIGKVDGYTLFIKDAIIGDVVEAKVMKAKKNYGYARLMNVLRQRRQSDRRILYRQNTQHYREYRLCTWCGSE